MVYDYAYQNLHIFCLNIYTVAVAVDVVVVVVDAVADVVVDAGVCVPKRVASVSNN